MKRDKPSVRGWRRRMLSFRFAGKGLLLLMRSQPNFRFHLLAAAGVIGAGFYFHVERWEWVALLLTISSVLVAEALNSALEFLTDLVSPQYHPLAGKAKDAAAAAVLIAALLAMGVGLVIFIPYLWPA